MKKILSLLFVIVALFSVFIPAYAAVSNEENVPQYSNGLSTSVMCTESAPALHNDASIAIDGEDVVYYGKNEIQPEDIIYAKPVTVYSANATGRISTRFEFDGTRQNEIASDFVDNIIRSGESANLMVNTCVWAPESNSLEIGIYNWTTAENWYVIQSGGSVIDRSFTFSSLTAGTYSVYIRNLGAYTLTTGYIAYNLT